MNGKGSKPRPISVPRNVFDDNWDAIFKKSKKKTQPRKKRLVSEY